MKKTNKLWLVLLLTVLVAALLAVGFTAAAEEPTIVDQGYCGAEDDGTNLTWVLTDDGTLTVSGEGAMADYNSSPSYPWSSDPITRVIVTPGVTKIGTAAFSRLNITEVTLPEGLLEIGNSAFLRCDLLESIVIPEGVTTLGSHLFLGCKALESITVPDSVEKIGRQVFLQTPWLAAQPDGLVYTGKVAYLYKGEMPEDTHIVLRDDCKGIAGGAFASCHNLTGITIPDSVTTIGAEAFLDCESLTSLTLNSGLTTIGASAFSCCCQIESIEIPASVTSIGDHAFFGFLSLQAFSVDPDNPAYTAGEDGCLYNKDKTELICYPVGNERTEFTVPDSVTTIDTYAFSSICGYIPPSDFAFPSFPGHLEGITVPASVTSIGEGAFTNNENMRYIKILNPNCSMDYHSFSFICDGDRVPTRMKIYGYPGSTAEASAHEAEVDACGMYGYGPLKNLFVALCPADEAHTVVQAEATDPTCTAAGHNAGWYCEDCGVYLSGEAQPALGHNWGEWEVIKQATVDETGLMRRTCQNDPTHVEEQVIPKLKPNTTVFQQFIETIKHFFENITIWFSRLFRW